MTNSPYGAPDPNNPGQQPPNWGAQAPQAGGSKFGTNPYDPATAGATMPKPAKQALLEKLTLISMALSLVSTLAYSAVMAGDDFADFMRDSYAEAGLPAEDVESMVDMMSGAAICGAVFGVVITEGLYLLVYFPLTKGKSRARVLGLVFAFIGVAGALLSLVSSGAFMFGSAVGILGAVAYLAYAVVTVYWIVTAFNQDVRNYLEQQSA